ncbi:glycosyl transferase family 64 protein [Nitzschia inconspicua]|uniref:Glycosyl transferase family 64 protein n=1 Tax=Nitzschia inconspicua TaxID=303405 RepID=A0A9K3L883_9STRA|nr:glycosyl transferase family 64 protein [Nitzschia inconspicua]
MVFGRFTISRKKDGEEDDQSQSSLPPFQLTSKDESSAAMYAFELASTASTDTDSSLSISDDHGQRQLPVVDLESPFGKLRHRAGELTHKQHANNNEEGPAVEDSDSEHGLLPRRRRKIISTSNRLLFHALATFVAISSLLSLSSTSAPSPVNSEEWRHFKMHTLPMVKKSFKKYEPENEYTIVLRGGRLDLLQQSIDNYARCSSVKEVQIDFEGTSAIPITLLSHVSRKVVPASESLPTSAVFLLSEGIMVSCTDMERGFQAWRKDPRRLIGFLGYKGSFHDAKSSVELQLVVPGTGSYAFVSDRAMFIHKLYLDSLANSESRSCCDVSLSAQVSMAFEKAPLVVKAKIADLVERSLDGQIRHCLEQCITPWLQVDGWRTIPQELTAILG